MHEKKKSFSLIEVLITVVIITVGVMSITKAFNVGLYASTDSENINTALNIAQATMEGLKDTPFGALADSGPSPDPDFPNFNVTVNVAEGQDPMQIDVTVSWGVKGGQASKTLTTLVADY